MTIKTFYRFALTSMLCSPSVDFSDVDGPDLTNKLTFEISSPDKTGAIEMQILENALINDADGNNGVMKILSISDDGNVEATHFAGMGSVEFGNISGLVAIVSLDEGTTNTDDAMNFAGHGQWEDDNYTVRLGLFSTDDGTTETQITRLSGETALIDALRLKGVLSTRNTDDGTDVVDTREMQLDADYALGNGLNVGLILTSFNNEDATGSEISEDMAFGFVARYEIALDDDITFIAGGKIGTSENTLADDTTINIDHKLGNILVEYDGDDILAIASLAIQESDNATTQTRYNIANIGAEIPISNDLSLLGHFSYISQEDDEIQVLTEQHTTLEAFYKASETMEGSFIFQQRDIDDHVEDENDQKKNTVGIGAIYYLP